MLSLVSRRHVHVHVQCTDKRTCCCAGFVSVGVSAYLQQQQQQQAEDEPCALDSDDVIAESVPLPRQLPGESQSVLVAMRNKTRQTGIFPEIDSLLLQVHVAAAPSPLKRSSVLTSLIECDEDNSPLLTGLWLLYMFTYM